MAILILIWIVLLTATYAIGSSLLHRLKLDFLSEPADRIAIACWLGIILLISSLLLASLVLPLNLATFVGILSAIFAVTLRPQFIFSEFSKVKQKASRKELLAYLLVMALTSFVVTQKVVWYDTGLYHLQVIQWLSKFGSVNGVALIHSRLGYTSSWFAFTAPFYSSALADRSTPIANGLILFLAILQFLLSLKRLLRTNKNLFRDYFWLFYFGLCAIYIAKWKIPVSASPDLPILILVGLTAWIYILLEEVKGKSGQEKGFILPAILSLGALVIKLVAIPIAAISVAILLFKYKLNFRRLFKPLIFLSLLPLSLFTVNLKVSGCLLFPSRVFCLASPWSSKPHAYIDRGWADLLNENQEPSFWLFDWFQAEKFGALLVILSLVAIAYLVFYQKTTFPGKGYLVILGTFCVAFVLMKAPSTRLGLGYLSILPAMLLSVIYQQASDRWFPQSLNRIFRKALVATLGLVFIFQLMQPSPFYSEPYHAPNWVLSRVFVPPKTIEPALIEYSIDNWQYAVPINRELCWASKIPCAIEKLEGISLSDPQAGFSKGFIRSAN